MSARPGAGPVPNPRGLVVVGASAGGVEALRALVGGLPADIDAAICVVLHVSRGGTSTLADILDRAGPLPAVRAADGAQLERGRIFVAPANFHTLVRDGRLRLSAGPAENGHRPAIDPLFRTAARAWGASVIGVVLSGSRDDGAFGLGTIATHGGMGLVQDPAEALYPSMPRHAMEQMPAARVAPAAKMGAVLAELVERCHGPRAITDDALLEAENAVAELTALTAEDIGAAPAGYGCPSCHGALFELPSGAAPRFRCRVGHAWTATELLEQQADALEGALWMALRSLEEKAALALRMAESAQLRGSSAIAARYTGASTEAAEASSIIRRLIGQTGGRDATTTSDAP